MPAQRNTNQSRRLTGAGLIAVTAATLLMMAWAIFPTPAFANGTHVWGEDDNKQGSPNLPCASGGHWIFQFTGTVTAATLHVGSEDITMSPQGGHFVADSTGPVDANTSVSVTWIGSGDGTLLTLSHCLGGTPDLGITKSASSTQVNGGGAFSYTITVANTGTGAATGVVVSDNLHDLFTAVSATFDGPGANDGPCTVGAGNQVTCNIGTLGAGQSATVTINATAPALPLTPGGACTRDYPNQATVDSDQTAPETSNTVTVTVTGTGCEEKTPDLGITKSASSTQVNGGGAFSYTITVANTGTGAATGVVVSDNLHDLFTAVSATFDGPGANDGPCTVGAGNQVTCNIGTLGAGQSATVTINATAPALPLTPGGACTRDYPNQATVDSDQTAPETSNTVTVTVTGTGCEEKTPDLGITKSASSTQVVGGGAFSYTITVANTGTGAATGVVVSDNLHDLFTAVSATFDGPGANDGPCTVGAGNQVTCNIGTLGAGQSATVTINATAPALPLTPGGACTLQTTPTRRPSTPTRPRPRPATRSRSR